MPFLGVLGRLQHAKRACILQQKCGFLCLFGLLGKGAALKKGVHFRAKVWISMPLWGCRRGLRSGKRDAFWSARVDFHTLFGLVRELRHGKRACILEQSVDFLPFLGSWERLQHGKRASSLGRGWRKMLFDLNFFSCVCLLASMARSVNCLIQKKRKKLYRSI